MSCDTDFNMEKISDEMMCKNYKSLDSSYKQNNHNMYQEFSYVPDVYKCFKNICDETTLYWPLENRLCDREVILYRGQNNKAPVNIEKKKNFLIPYCDCNTYRNHVVCNDSKCCSQSHQLFMNLTKRGCPANGKNALSQGRSFC